MSVQLTRLGVDDDLLTFWQTLSAGFPPPPEAPAMEVWFPNRQTPKGDAKIAQRLKKKQLQHDDPKEVHYVLASIDGKTAGAVIWVVLDKPQSLDVEAYYGDADGGDLDGKNEQDMKFARVFWEQYYTPRSKLVSDHAEQGKQTWVMEWMAVLPNARRRGVGEALVAYGLNLADEAGVQSLTEGTKMGRSLYTKLGFETLQDLEFDLGEDFKDRRTPELCLMRRPVPS